MGHGFNHDTVKFLANPEIAQRNPSACVGAYVRECVIACTFALSFVFVYMNERACALG